MIRDGIVTGAIGGMKARDVGERAVGVVVDGEAANSEIRISIVSGVVELWSSSWRGTSAPATAKAAA